MRHHVPHLILSELLFAVTVSLSGQCLLVQPGGPVVGGVSFTFNGGGMQSFGCAPIDPTYWMSGSSMSITTTITTPADVPGIRVWGMNTDDIASVVVNGAAYPLNASAAYFLPKVVCGLSPGPDGVAFVGGNITGANTPVEGNFSYQDVFLNTTSVTSIVVSGLAGAGWGFDGVLLNCATTVPEQALGPNALFPNPANERIYLPMYNSGPVDVSVMNDLGQVVMQERTTDGMIMIDALPSGAYVAMVRSAFDNRTVRFVRE